LSRSRRKAPDPPDGDGTVDDDNVNDDADVDIAPIDFDADFDADIDVDEIRDVEIATPDLPPGRFVQLGDRGVVVVRDFGEPANLHGPPIALLHGWTASADLNWFRCYEELGKHHRVFAFDHRGHAGGLRTDAPFRLEDCADDVVDVASELGIDRFIAVGYSMGGPIAQLTWHRHRDRVAGLVLCATAPYFSTGRPEKLSFLGLAGLATLARFAPIQAKEWLTEQLYLQRKSATWEPWAVKEASSHDWRMLLEAGREIGSFSSMEWIEEVDVPTAVVITMRDRVIPLSRQARLFDKIPNAAAFRVNGDHDAVVAGSEQFVPTLLRALDSVVARLLEADR